MRFSSLIFAALVCCVATDTIAQSVGSTASAAASVATAPPVSPSACRRAALKRWTAQYDSVSGGKPLTLSADQKKALRALQTDFMRECAARYSVATVDPAWLGELITLYSDAKLNDSIPVIMGRIEREHLRGAAIDAHSRLADKASDTDDYPGIFTHARAALAEAEQATPAERSAAASAIAQAYHLLAYAYGNKLHPDSALAALQRGAAQLQGTKEAASIQQDIRRYSLVGTEAVPIVVDQWSNAKGSQTPLPTKGAPTLLEFSAYTCVYCRLSYPIISRFNTTYGPRGLRTVVTEQIESDFNGSTLSESDWIEANRKFMVVDNGVNFPIALERADTARALRVLASAGGASADSSENDGYVNTRRYAVGGVPQFVLIDKRGVIRHVIVGWDAGSEATIGGAIEKMLAE